MNVRAEAPHAELLEAIFDEVETLQWAAQFVDPQLRLVWLSGEMRELLGTEEPEELGYGRHIVEVYLSEVWNKTITYESTIESFMRELPYFLHATPGGKETLREMFPERWRGEIDKFGPAEMPVLWTGHLLYVQGDLPPVRVHHLTTAVNGPEGELLGHLRVYGPGLRAGLTALAARGSTAMFERMARIREPGRRRAAILFADMQSSSALSRKLSSSAYFALIRRLFTAIDDVVVHQGGIVGKHAGDGVTAFFLADDLGSDSAAARTALETAQRIREAVDDAVLDTDGLLESGECLFNVGVHWGGALYMGQVVTGGRIEVTALGDEVNEGARVQQAAKEGHVLATKHLVERLTEDDARSLGVDADRLVYTTVSDMPDAPDKSRRDAGGLSVVDLFPPGS
jgi:class 3 adenylate cyclase